MAHERRQQRDRGRDRSCRLKLRSVIAVAAAVLCVLSVGSVSLFTMLSEADVTEAMSRRYSEAEFQSLSATIERMYGPIDDARPALTDWAAIPGVCLPADAPDLGKSIDAAQHVVTQVGLSIPGTRGSLLLILFDGNLVSVYKDDDVFHSVAVIASNTTTQSQPCCGVLVTRSYNATTYAHVPLPSRSPPNLTERSTARFTEQQLSQLHSPQLRGYSAWVGPVASADATEVIVGFSRTILLSNATGHALGLAVFFQAGPEARNALRLHLEDSLAVAAALTTEEGLLVATTTGEPVGYYRPPHATVCAQPSQTLSGELLCIKHARQADFAPLRIAGETGVLESLPDESNEVTVTEVADGGVHFVLGTRRYRGRGPVGLVMSLYIEHDVLHPDRTTRLRETIIAAVGAGAIAALICVAIVTLVMMPVGDLAHALRLTSTYHPAPTSLLLSHSRFSEVWELERALQRLVRLMHAFKSYVPRDVIRAFVVARNDPRSVGEALQFRRTARCTVMAVMLENFTAVPNLRALPEMSSVLAAANKQLQQLLRTFGGSIVSIDGDIVVAAWGPVSPLPNAEFRAILCALLIHRSAFTGPVADALDAAGEWARARIGIATGPVMAGVTGRTGVFTVVGEAVTGALRLQSRAFALESRPLTTETTTAATGRLFVTRPLLVRVAAHREYGHTAFGDVDPRNLRFDDHADGGSRTGGGGGGPRAVKVHEVFGVVSAPALRDTLALRAAETAMRYAAGTANGSGSEAPSPSGRDINSDDDDDDDDEARGRVDAVRLLDMALALVDHPVDVTRQELAIAKACKRAVKALQVGRVWVARRRAERLLHQLPDGHWAVPATVALVDSLSTPDRPEA